MALFGRRKQTEASNQRFLEIRQRLVKTASDQSFQLKIIKEQEAASVAQLCGFTDKPHDSAAFVDVALMLLCLPSELALVVALEFSNFAHQVGFQPFGTIMVAVGHIDSLYRGMYVRKSLLDQKPELYELLNSKELRIERAAKLLATGLFVSSQSVTDARQMYRTMSADPVVKERLAEEIRTKDQDLARVIVG